MSHFKNILRLGVFLSYDPATQTATIKMLDRSVDRPLERCDMPSAVWGAYSIPPKNTKVLIGYGYREKPYIVQFLTNAAFAQDLTQSSNTKNILVTDVQYPDLKPGEVALQGVRGAKVLLNALGELSFEFGDSSIKYNANNFSITDIHNQYSVSESGLSFSGIIRRDTRSAVSDVDRVANKLTSVKYESSLTDIGRNPKKRTSIISDGSDSIRNPALVEDRQLTYEFARSFMVGSIQEEKDRIAINYKSNSFFSAPDRRDMSRSDVLNLNDKFRNNLLEEVRGTLVDRYGNLLDINRKILNVKSLTDKVDLDYEDIQFRRTIKYHFELNAKKESNQTISYKDALGPDIKNGHLHSRWSLDIDGEGLTKINIPASSNTGNIPVLARHIPLAFQKEVGDQNILDSYRDPSKVDVSHIPFGAASGVSAPRDALPPQVASVVTAYHDITKTASKIVPSATSTSISNDVANANAGGKSVHANLDGSLEMNVGRDTIDHKSIVLDTSGSMLARLGKDKNGNSLVAQTDGNIAVQVGGDTITNTATPETANAVHSLQVFVRTVDSSGNPNFHKINITNESIIIESAPGKDLVLKSGGNIVLDAAADTWISGENVGFFGNTNQKYDGTVVGRAERIIARNGKVIE